MCKCINYVCVIAATCAPGATQSTMPACSVCVIIKSKVMAVQNSMMLKQKHGLLTSLTVLLSSMLSWLTSPFANYFHSVVYCYTQNRLNSGRNKVLSPPRSTGLISCLHSQVDVGDTKMLRLDYIKKYKHLPQKNVLYL